MSDLATQIEALRQDYRDGLIDRDTFGQLMKALTQPATAIRTEGGAGVAGDVTTDGGDFVGRDLLIYGNVYHGPQPDDPAEALRIYREVILNESDYLPLGGLDRKTADASNRDKPLTLANVYVSLNTKTKQTIAHGSRGDDSEESIPITALGACGRHPALVLIGDPGGGKSTFINHLVYSLCAHQLGKEGIADKLTPQHNALQPAQLDLIPLKVVLRDFAATLPEKPRTPKEPPLAVLDQFIHQQLDNQNLGFVYQPLEKALQAGRVWMLFDGLDEVTNDYQRGVVREAVAAFATRYGRCRYVATCRTIPYQDPTYQLDPHRFVVMELDEFDATQRDAFVQGWYDELVGNRRLAAPTAAALATQLQQSIRRPDLWRLAGNPLLLTIMALVHTDKRRLPQGRAQLYEETVDVLLWRWEEVKLGTEGLSALRQLLEQVGRADFELRRALAEVAYTVHQQATVDGAGKEAVADVSLVHLYQALAPLSPDHGWAQKVVGVMQKRAGLLVERDLGVFAFPHRTFQEYLAGVHLANSHNAEGLPDFPQRAAALADQPQWRTVILLAVGYLTYVKPEPTRVLALLTELCPTTAVANSWPKVWLAGEAILEMGVQRVQDTELGRSLWERIRQRLAQLLEGEHLTPRERMEAGMVLGQIGDPRRGVGMVVREDGLAIPDIAWGKTVLAGTYTVGDKREDDNPVREITIAHEYQLAKYPVTYVQFQCFVEAEDYGDARWWVGMLEEEEAYGTNYNTKQLSEQAFPYANHPREQVSWYQAVAFCRWLSDKLGDEVRLPHEHEWEVAARYNEGRMYPWGNEFDKDKANTIEGQLQQTTAVGLYPSGRQPHLDLYDLSGNVWELCQNKRHDFTQVEVDESGDGRVLRGGSLINIDNFARAAFRSDFFPSSRNFFVGLRVVRVPRPLSLLRPLSSGPSS